MDNNKPEVETENSVSNSDSTNLEPKVENSVENTPAKVGDGSEYESAEEDGDKITDKNLKESPKDQESVSELVDEEGGEEGIAEQEDIEGDFLSGDQPDGDGEIEDVNVTHIDEDNEGDADDADEGDNDEANEADIDEADEGDIDEADEGDEAEENSDEYADERQSGDDEGSEEGEYVEEERQQGDGEECSPVDAVTEKELDFDEDRRNPQYIPKKGIFYEHDDRNEDVKEKDEEPARDRKKKLWLDEGKWGHDRFRLEEQFPKSKHELIETYGYDIRNEDGPPRARRRRRYGRGPTKYVRNWEDVSAYAREKFRGSPRGNFRGRRAVGRIRGAPRFRGRGRKDFISNDCNKQPYLIDDEAELEEPEIKENKEIDLKVSVPVINTKEFPALPSKDSIIESEIIEKRPYFQRSLSETPESKSVRTLTFENSNFSARNSLERDVPSIKNKSVVYGRQPDKNITHLDKSVAQTTRSFNQYEKSINHQEKNLNKYEKNVNFHERNVNQYERNVNHYDKNSHQYEKNVNMYDRNIKQLERSASFNDKPLSHTHHDRGARKPVSRGSRGSGRGDYNRRGRGIGMRHISPRFLENKVNNLSNEVEQLNIDDVADVCNGLTTEKVRQVDNDIVPSSESEITNVSVKGTGDSSSRPKRYSSLRQRSLPESTTYQTSQPAVPTQSSAYYESGYQPALYAPTNTGVPTPSTQSQSATSPPLMNPSGFHPYDCGIRLQLLPRAIFPQPTMPTGQSVLAPPPPSPCIPPPPNANLMDFAPPPPPSGYHQYAYQQYAQPPPPPPPSAPSDIYQPGITYYFAQQTQSTSTRPTVQKRPKAAIPILPPPERENKKDENKESLHTNSNSNRKSSNDAVNGDVPSLRTDSSQQLSSVGVES